MTIRKGDKEDLNIGTGASATGTKINAGNLPFDDPNGASNIDQLLQGTALELQCLIPTSSSKVANKGYVDGLVDKVGTPIANVTANLKLLSGYTYVEVSGTTDITSFDTVATSAGKKIIIKFTSIMTLTDDGNNLILPGGSDIKTYNGFVATFVEYSGGKWIMISQHTSGLVLLETNNISTPIQAVEFKSRISTSYAYYLVKFANVKMTTTLTTMYMQVSVDNGVNYKGGVDDYAQGGATSAAFYTISNSVGTPDIMSGQVRLYNPMDTTVTTVWESDCIMYADGGTVVTRRENGAYWGSINAVNAIKIYSSSSTFASGKISLYGYVD